MSVRAWRDVLRRFAGRGTYPHQLSFLLSNPLRRLVDPPERLADRLELSADFRVLEIGPGPGFYSVEVARRIPRGHLELYDIQPEMLAKARRKLERAGLENFGCTVGDAANLPFDAGTFDVAFLVAVLGEVTDRRACVRSVHRVLRDGGLLSVTEMPGDPDRLSVEQVRRAAEGAGFRWIETIPGFRGYTATFRRAS